MTAAVNIPDYNAGDSLIMEFTVLDKATSFKSAKNLTRAVATWTLEKRYGNTITPLIKYASDDVGPNVSITDAANGLVRVTLDAEAFTQVGDYHHNLKININGIVETVAGGRFFSK